MMNIVACASDNYVMQCGVLFCSVCENNRNEQIHFYVITDKSFTEEHKEDLKSLVAYYNKQVTFLQVSDRQIDLFLGFENYYYTRHVFYRLLMADLLPRDVEKVLYLDCDIVVRHSLASLWGIDISNVGVGVVHDAQEGLISKYNRLGYSYDKGYFNSGVLYANLKYWREHQSSKKMFDYIMNNPTKIEMPDQDPLNVIFQDEKIFIPFTYNLQSYMLFRIDMLTFDYFKYKEELDTCKNDPVILHFSGERPWIKGSKHPYRAEFFKYRMLTKWKNEPLWKNPAPLREKIFKSNNLRRFLSKLGLCHVIENLYELDLSLK